MQTPAEWFVPKLKPSSAIDPRTPNAVYQRKFRVMWASVILVSGVAMMKKPNVATKPPSSVSETPSVFGLNPNGKITGKYQLSIAYGNLCVISAMIGDLPVRHQRAPLAFRRLQKILRGLVADDSDGS